MSKGAAHKRGTKVLALDPDRLGMLGGSALATVVLAVGLFVRQAEIVESIVRAGIAFAVVYAAVFILVYVIRSIAEKELEQLDAEERERQEGEEGKDAQTASGE